MTKHNMLTQNFVGQERGEHYPQSLKVSIIKKIRYLFIYSPLRAPSKTQHKVNF